VILGKVASATNSPSLSLNAPFLQGNKYDSTTGADNRYGCFIPFTLSPYGIVALLDLALPRQENPIGNSRLG
jgi:hypothetical protein